MRIFVAMDLPSKVKDYLYDLQNKLKNSGAKVHWVPKKNIHLTLKFFGDINEKQLKDLKIKFKSFDLTTDVIGVFPDEKQIRVLWVEVTPEDELLKLQQDIDSNTLDISSKPQEFKAHLTLGRVKWVRNKIEYMKFLQSIPVKRIRFAITNFYLYNSELSKDGSKYTRLEEYTLEE